MRTEFPEEQYLACALVFGTGNCTGAYNRRDWMEISRWYWQAYPAERADTDSFLIAFSNWCLEQNGDLDSHVLLGDIG